MSLPRVIVEITTGCKKNKKKFCFKEVHFNWFVVCLDAVKQPCEEVLLCPFVCKENTRLIILNDIITLFLVNCSSFILPTTPRHD